MAKDNPNNKERDYDNFAAELQQFRNYLLHNPATATMASVAISCYRPNACRYVSMLKEKGLIAEIGTFKCKITGFKAKYLTCNPEVVERLTVKK